MPSIFLSFPEASVLALYSWPNWFFTPGWSWHSLLFLKCKWLGTFVWFQSLMIWTRAGKGICKFCFVCFLPDNLLVSIMGPAFQAVMNTFYSLVLPITTSRRAVIPSVSSSPLGSKHPKWNWMCKDFIRIWNAYVERNREGSRGRSEYPGYPNANVLKFPS